MRKRDTVRNINKLTALMDANVLIGHSTSKGYIKASTIRPIKFENCLDGVFAYSYNHWRTKETITDFFIKKGVRSLDEDGGVNLTAKMIKYLQKINVIVVDAQNKFSFNFDAYKMWCETYNLPVSRKVKNL